MPEFFLFLSIVFTASFLISLIVNVTILDWSSAGVWVTSLSFVAILVATLILSLGSSYWAGQGDGARFAREWTARWRPDSDVECQPMDTDDNGYITCTVGQQTAERATSKPVILDAIECGVNRWYQGYKVTGCRLLKGSQP